MQQTGHDGSEYSMAEEEWIALLEQVEREMQQAQMEQALEEQDMYLEHQVASYEQWQLEARSAPDKLAEGTPCPLCSDGNLLTTGLNDIVCPNYMDESCHFRMVNASISLSGLHKTLQNTIEQHSKACSGTVSFHFEPASQVLLACCPVCQGTQQLLG